MHAHTRTHTYSNTYTHTHAQIHISVKSVTHSIMSYTKTDIIRNKQTNREWNKHEARGMRQENK